MHQVTAHTYKYPLLYFSPTAAPPVESMVEKNKRIYENFEAAVCVRKIYVEGELCVCDVSEVCVCGGVRPIRSERVERSNPSCVRVCAHPYYPSPEATNCT